MRSPSQRRYYEEHREEILAKQRTRKKTDEYRAKAAEYRHRPEVEARLRQWSIEHNYGIPYAEYEHLEAEQNGKCTICGKAPDPNAPFKPQRHLHVDHNHETGEVRALLCAQCNRAIGLMKDSSGLLRRAADYLDGNKL